MFKWKFVESGPSENVDLEAEEMENLNKLQNNLDLLEAWLQTNTVTLAQESEF